MTSSHFIKEFKHHAIYRIDENYDKLKHCIQLPDEKEIWERDNPASNSTGNLILHLCGNITQYIVSSLGKKEDKRERDAEFAATGGFTKKELWNKFTEVILQAKSIIENISDEQLIAYKSVQGFSFSGIGIILHVVEHLSYHTGQIAYRIKQLKNKDLGFYNTADLNKKNEL